MDKLTMTMPSQQYTIDQSIACIPHQIFYTIPHPVSFSFFNLWSKHNQTPLLQKKKYSQSLSFSLEIWISLFNNIQARMMFKDNWTVLLWLVGVKVLINCRLTFHLQSAFVRGKLIIYYGPPHQYTLDKIHTCIPHHIFFIYYHPHFFFF